MKRQKLRFDWHPHNQAELLVDGVQFFPSMLSAIEQAERSIYMEFYYVHSGRVMDRFIEALDRAVDRGVRVCVQFDGFGAFGFWESDRQRLRRAGVSLTFFNPIRLSKWNHNFARDHRKLMVVDGRVVYVGGAGLSDHFLDGVPAGSMWHELMVRLEGPVARDWTRLFNRVWRYSTGETLPEPAPCLPCGGAAMKVSVTERRYRQEIKFNFRRQVRRARSRVWLATAYFLPSWSVRRALRNAAERGVDVRLLLPGPIHDHPGLYYAARRYYKQLLTAGVRIFEYQPRFIHAKAGICDEWVSLGSCNLDHWNLRWNLEANIEISDPGFTDRLCLSFLGDIEESQEITLEQWLARPWYQRATEFVRGYMNAIILRIV